ncbi:hypothetical protein NCCP1664_07630 [Zafaria cholistanensis]|uniref:Uncharacterized protein n=1 Tax=Zafaria cholistanensis TaxID=1682741 RepID=A0A5A7NP09_9MICC|nr:DUF6176 family protein [Zafaria cholistanensis]GER22266.1 hypothetical protein NCCP1664_07630 [Zafaria cholistanensis]
MECITWFTPILPGKLDQWKLLIEEINGPRKQEHLRSRERMGVVREVASLMQTPQGDFACLFLEGEDLSKSSEVAATSDDPYDQWFREQAREIHGITPEMLRAPIPATLMFDSKAG